MSGPITPTRQSDVYGASPSAPSTTTHQSDVLGASSAIISNAPVSSWTESDVQAWLKQTKLDELCETPIARFNGEYLQELYNNVQKDPAKFEGDMTSDVYKMNAEVYLRFKVELTKLKFANQNPTPIHVRLKNFFCCK